MSAPKCEKLLPKYRTKMKVENRADLKESQWQNPVVALYKSETEHFAGEKAPVFQYGRQRREKEREREGAISGYRHQPSPWQAAPSWMRGLTALDLSSSLETEEVRLYYSIPIL